MFIHKYLFGLIALLSVSVHAGIQVVDASGTTLTLSAPAKKIVTLAPHLTELVYSAGAGHQLAGVISHSDFPPQAARLPVIGSYDKINYEAIIALQPDIIFAWKSGSGEATIKRLRQLGFTVYVSEFRVIADIAAGIRDMGVLTGHQSDANLAADRFLQEYKQLVSSNQHKRPVKVFYQLWHQPVMTVNKAHTISDALQVCRGENIFAEAIPLVPKVNVETVIRRNPEVIIAAGEGAERPAWLDDWRQWNDITAVKINGLYAVHPDLMHRQTVRILDGISKLCQVLDEARKKLARQVNKAGGSYDE